MAWPVVSNLNRCKSSGILNGSLLSLPSARFFEIAAIAEKGSEHPIGQAIVKKATEQNPKIPNATSYETISGKGIKAVYLNKIILVGNRKFLEENRFPLDELENTLQKLEIEGKTAVIEPDSGKCRRGLKFCYRFALYLAPGS